jgi:hypothetical protein
MLVGGFAPGKLPRNLIPDHRARRDGRKLPYHFNLIFQAQTSLR